MDDLVLYNDVTFYDLRESVTRKIGEAFIFLADHPDEEDRVEFNIADYQIKVWRTIKNTKVSHHLGYKSEWHRTYYPVSVDDLIEWIVKCRGNLPRRPVTIPTGNQAGSQK